MGQTIFLHAQGCLFFGKAGCGLDESLHCEPCSKQNKTHDQVPVASDQLSVYRTQEQFNDDAHLVEGDL